MTVPSLRTRSIVSALLFPDCIVPTTPFIARSHVPPAGGVLPSPFVKLGVGGAGFSLFPHLYAHLFALWQRTSVCLSVS